MRLEYMVWWIWSGWYTYDGSVYLGTQKGKKSSINLDTYSNFKNRIINFYLKKIINGSNPLTLE